MTKKLSLAALALVLGACAVTPAPNPKADAEGVQQAIAAAEAANRKADEVGFQWRDAEDLIKQAKEAAAKQDYVTALKLAGQAERQGQLAYRQYEASRNASPPQLSQGY